jgi:hypothetical protein
MEAIEGLQQCSVGRWDPIHRKYVSHHLKYIDIRINRFLLTDIDTSEHFEVVLHLQLMAFDRHLERVSHQIFMFNFSKGAGKESLQIKRIRDS